MRLLFLILLNLQSICEAVDFEIVKESSPFPAYMFSPVTQGPRPALLLLHGSLGGYGDFWYRPGEKPRATGKNQLIVKIAQSFARRGYVAMALCYFDCDHHKGLSNYPPNELVKVDLEQTTIKALAWLKSHKKVRGQKLALWGMSRGAEQALLVASYMKNSESGYPDAVVSLSPSDYVVRQFTKENAEKIKKGEAPFFKMGPAWRFGDFLPKVGSPIAIENYKSPILITSFEKDPVWGERVDVNRIRKRFEGKGFKVDKLLFSKNDLAKDKMKQAKTFANNRLFVEYQSSGHVFHKREEREAFSFQYQIVDWFLKKNL